MCRQCVAHYMIGHGHNTAIDAEAWAAIEWPEQTVEMAALAHHLSNLYLFTNCAMGGPLHIVVEDYNVEDVHIDYCERTLDDHWSVVGAPPDEQAAIVECSRVVIDLLRQMDEKQRVVALGRAAGIVPA